MPSVNQKALGMRLEVYRNLTAYLEESEAEGLEVSVHDFGLFLQSMYPKERRPVVGPAKEAPKAPRDRRKGIELRPVCMIPDCGCSGNAHA